MVGITLSPALFCGGHGVAHSAPDGVLYLIFSHGDTVRADEVPFEALLSEWFALEIRYNRGAQVRSWRPEIVLRHSREPPQWRSGTRFDGVPHPNSKATFG